MGRRTSLASLAGKPIEDVPGHSTPTLVRLKPDQIVPTPLNPRKNFGTEEELTELGESLRVRQLQPVVAVSRTAYLKLWPEHEPIIGEATYVLANGERRYRSARHVGLDFLDVLIREDVADNRARFIDAVVSENLDRRNFDPIEEAHAVEAMVAECGSANEAAERFRRHKTWVSQRRALLRLTSELQEKVRVGDLPVRIARSIASHPPEDQEMAWKTTREREAAEAQERSARRQEERAAVAASSVEAASQRPTGSPTSVPMTTQPQSDRTTEVNRPNEAVGITEPEPGGGQITAVNQPTDATASKLEDDRFTAVNRSATTRRETTSPVLPSADTVVPWESPSALAALIRDRLSPDDVAVLVHHLTTPAV
ncbi:ParB/RepB/Spo0J family partition protein [Actinocorallia populi]|uniref:ParB/RepB/Spo0J family partition protein n=1 Tax=Actinocorallia populi TaxID=2079200 RepID=UPI000D092E5C|nr:ParB/RepB/Spo0J family partition protein [Actinocorallia populi]